MARDSQGLTPKMRRFVDEFCVDQNATAAATRSGFSARSAHARGWKLLRDPYVRDAIAHQEAQRLDALRVTADRIMRRTAAIAFSDPRKMFREDGTLKGLHEMDDDTAASIAGIDVEEIFAGRGEDRVKVGNIRKVRRWDAVRALELVARLSGMLDGNTVNVKLDSGVKFYLPTNGRDPVDDGGASSS